MYLVTDIIDSRAKFVNYFPWYFGFDREVLYSFLIPLVVFLLNWIASFVSWKAIILDDFRLSTEYILMENIISKMLSATHNYKPFFFLFLFWLEIKDGSVPE